MNQGCQIKKKYHWQNNRFSAQTHTLNILEMLPPWLTTWTFNFVDRGQMCHFDEKSRKGETAHVQFLFNL